MKAACAAAVVAVVCATGCLMTDQGSMELSPRVRDSSSYKGGGLLSWKASSGGPRMGLVLATGEAADQLAQVDAGPVLTTWGWQFELQYGSHGHGMEGVIEIIPLITGMDAELDLVSLNVLFGLRGGNGVELCAGPYVSGTGSGMTVAIGKTVRAGELSLPMNLSVTSTQEGPRYCFTFGWNIRAF